jgi:glycosyltransferase involved in cell wall biosynthesis
VDTETFRPIVGARRGFISVSRFVPYKRIPLIVEAFRQMPDLELTVVGDGPDRARCHEAARGAANIRFLGHAPIGELPRLLSGAQAFLFAALEDFGIAPLEAQACGTPVIAYGAGGALETVIDGETGSFFEAQTPDAIVAAVRRFLAAAPPSETACRRQAERFAIPAFQSTIREVIARAWHDRPTPDTTRYAGGA